MCDGLWCVVIVAKKILIFSLMLVWKSFLFCSSLSSPRPARGARRLIGLSCSNYSFEEEEYQSCRSNAKQVPFSMRSCCWYVRLPSRKKNGSRRRRSTRSTTTMNYISSLDLSGRHIIVSLAYKVVHSIIHHGTATRPTFPRAASSRPQAGAARGQSTNHARHVATNGQDVLYQVCWNIGA
jgi:hypothetical protein